MGENKNLLLSRNVDIEPVAVVYNVMAQTVAEFTEDYLTKKQDISGLAAVRTKVVRDGSANPIVNVYVFINLKSPELSSSNGDMIDALKEKMADNSYHYSGKLKNALWSICKDISPSVSVKDGVLVVKADIYKIFGLMFDAPPRNFEIGMLEVMKLKKQNAAISVMKKTRFVGSEDVVTNDRFDNMVLRFDD